MFKKTKKKIKRYIIISIISIIFLLIYSIVNMSDTYQRVSGEQNNALYSVCVFNESFNTYLTQDISDYQNYKKEYDYIYKVVLFMEDGKNKEEIIKRVNEYSKNKDKDVLSQFYDDPNEKVNEVCQGFENNDNTIISGTFSASDKGLSPIVYGSSLGNRAITALAWYYPAGGWHPAMDIGVPMNTELHAPANGIILALPISSGGYGRGLVALIETDESVYTIILGHTNRYNVKVGQSFKKGDVIAYSGNTGMSTGPHVHIEIMKHNSSKEVVLNKWNLFHDYWFGLAYTSVGDCKTSCRLRPHEVYGYKLGQVLR